MFRGKLFCSNKSHYQNILLSMKFLKLSNKNNLSKGLTGQQNTARINCSSSLELGAPPTPNNRMRPPYRLRNRENKSWSHIVLLA